MALHGYLDLSTSELLAATRGLGLDDPKWLFYGQSSAVDPAGGRQSLITRRVAAAKDGEAHLDPNVGAVLRAVCRPVFVMNIVSVTGTEAEMTWLLVDSNTSAIVSSQLPESFRVRATEVSQIAPLLAILLRINADGLASTHAVAFSADVLRDLSDVVEIGRTPTAALENVARDVTALFGPGSRCVALQSAFPAETGAIREFVCFVEDATGGYAVLRIEPPAVRFEPADGISVRARVTTLLPSPRLAS